MTQVTCQISGIKFQCEYFTSKLSLNSNDWENKIAHPIFYIKPTKLISLYREWLQSNITPIESYLLIIASLNSTGLLKYSTHINKPTEEATLNRLVSLYLPKVVTLVSELRSISHPTFQPPHISVTKENCNLDAIIKSCIYSWQLSLDEFNSAMKSFQDLKALQKETTRIKNLSYEVRKNPQKFINQLANWAAEAAEFPTFEITTVEGTKKPCKQYWIDIIKACANDDKIFKIPKSDIDELLEHCEEHLPATSLYKKELMNHLKQGLLLQQNYLGFNIFELEDIDLVKTKVPNNYSILNYAPIQSNANSEAVEQAAKAVAALAAPLTEPKPENYPSRISYLKDKARWDLKIKSEGI